MRLKWLQTVTCSPRFSVEKIFVVSLRTMNDTDGSLENGGCEKNRSVALVAQYDTALDKTRLPASKYRTSISCLQVRAHEHSFWQCASAVQVGLVAIVKYATAAGFLVHSEWLRSYARAEATCSSVVNMRKR